MLRAPPTVVQGVWRKEGGLPGGHSWTEPEGTRRSLEKAEEQGLPWRASRRLVSAQSISGTHLLLVFILGLPSRFVNICSDSKPIL